MLYQKDKVEQDNRRHTISTNVWPVLAHKGNTYMHILKSNRNKINFKSIFKLYAVPPPLMQESRLKGRVDPEGTGHGDGTRITHGAFLSEPLDYCNIGVASSGQGDSRSWSNRDNRLSCQPRVGLLTCFDCPGQHPSLDSTQTGR